MLYLRRGSIAFALATALAATLAALAAPAVATVAVAPLAAAARMHVHKRIVAVLRNLSGYAELLFDDRVLLQLSKWRVLHAGRVHGVTLQRLLGRRRLVQNV